ncbi:MAG: DUF2834 domain-containing protein [Anaerolineae bacterium]|jgi:hypothetical protein
MRLKHLCIVLCIIGVVLPYTQFIPWVVENGLNVSLLVDQIASSRLAAFGWLDVIVAALALFVFIVSDGRQHRVPGLWLPIVGTLAVGVSLGLPLYLLLREIRREAAP